MWQRIQTIFLLIAAITAISFLFVPLAVYEDGRQWLAKDDVTAAGISIAIAIIVFFAISRFKNRKLQIRLCFLSILLSLALVLWCVYSTSDGTVFSEVNYAFIIGIPCVIILSLFFARRNIRKDDDLVKSMNRMR